MKELFLRKKLTFRTGGKKIVLVKKSNETFEHVAAKAVGYAMYLPVYPQVKIEVKIGERYKPDLVALNGRGEPVFWAECCMVGKTKIEKILNKHPSAHFAFIRVTEHVDQFADLVSSLRERTRHKGKLDIIRLKPPVTRYFDGHDIKVPPFGEAVEYTAGGG
ncbi:MAG: hypothetical protein GF408_00650 [Candidatus Omnitrophica bacterium]|nr:hypothetical protein [Candidatus Omnitrophota bacterium]